MRSGFFLKGGARDLLHRFKYDGEIWLAGDIGDLIRRQIEPELDPAGWDVLLPTPLHSRRLKKRGFNQAEEMARALSRAWGIPVLKGAVRRDRMTEKQALLTAAGRRRNVVGAFRVRSPRGLAGKRILLVDDVTTTGATLGELASVLRRLPRDQRPLEIGAVTFARGGF
jgi:ComF family protein